MFPSSLTAVNYRLAPDSKYPSQLFEAYSSWRHLRKLGYDSILIGGDSAGANLALTLWRYLAEVAGEDVYVKGQVLHSVSVFNLVKLVLHILNSIVHGLARAVSTIVSLGWI